MVPRADIVAVPDDISLGELRQGVREGGHSRLRRLRGDARRSRRHGPHPRPDRLHDRARRGVAGRRRAGARRRSGRARSSGRSTCRCRCRRPRSCGRVLFVPPSMPAIDLLAKMQATRIHLALVIDEYGGTDGLVSIEDIVETGRRRHRGRARRGRRASDRRARPTAPSRRRPRQPRRRRRAWSASTSTSARRPRTSTRWAASSSRQVGRAAGARRTGAGSRTVRDRGARRRSAPRQAAAHPPPPADPAPSAPRRRAATATPTAPADRATAGLAVAGQGRRIRRTHVGRSGGGCRAAQQRVAAVKLDRLAHRIVLAWGWRRAAIAFAAGAVSALALAPFDLWPADVRRPFRSPSGCSTAPASGRWGGVCGRRDGRLVVRLRLFPRRPLVDRLRLPGRRARPFGWLMPFAVLALPAGLALFTALGFAARALRSGREGRSRILVFAAALTADRMAARPRAHRLSVERVRHALTGPLALAQSAVARRPVGPDLRRRRGVRAPGRARRRAHRHTPALARAAPPRCVVLAAHGDPRRGPPCRPSDRAGRRRAAAHHAAEPAAGRRSSTTTPRREVMQRYLALSDRATGPQSTGIRATSPT